MSLDTTVQEKNITYPTYAKLLPRNPYDGHTPAETLARIESFAGVAVAGAYVDKGYRGYGYSGAVDVHVAGQRRKDSTRAQRMRRRRRSAVEPKIGHIKSDYRMYRCFLAGLEGDGINAMLAAAGSNLRKLLRRLAAALIRWLRITSRAIWSRVDPQTWLPQPQRLRYLYV